MIRKAILNCKQESFKVTKNLEELLNFNSLFLFEMYTIDRYFQIYFDRYFSNIF